MTWPGGLPDGPPRRLTLRLALLTALIQAIVPVYAMAVLAPARLLLPDHVATDHAAHGADHHQDHQGRTPAAAHDQLCSFCLVFGAAPLVPASAVIAEALLRPKALALPASPKAIPAKHRLTSLHPRAPPLRE